MGWLGVLHDLPISLLKTATCGDICSAKFTCRASPCRAKLWAVGVSNCDSGVYNATEQQHGVQICTRTNRGVYDNISITFRFMIMLYWTFQINDLARKCHLFSWFPNVSQRSQWPRILRRGSAAVRSLGLRVRIPPGALMFFLCDCCVLSGNGLCAELITSPEESYRVWWVHWLRPWNLIQEILVN
jgi:hypothetical protein